MIVDLDEGHRILEEPRPKTCTIRESIESEIVGIALDLIRVAPVEHDVRAFLVACKLRRRNCPLTKNPRQKDDDGSFLSGLVAASNS
jgi:hypothetical protein